MKQIDVLIMGQSYLLGCPEGGEATLQAAVSRVDAAMCSIRDAGKLKARDRIAVLAALNLAFDLVAQAGAAPAPAPAPMPSHTDHPALAENSAAGQRLTQLLARLDQALQQDGCLL